ncbi:MAG: cell division protein CrgA [Rothia sp. (in: high G+C Gram-positive bacteria)]|uniref:cell division protein CrgA n=1 Tax=Rothia sp. (in: high G+C Gram-positive bacteria) TaxID=1885016 RepID=UPI0026DD199B|nr:cell division protein CrgA [Rothia sp. (in: high G+C Gram-positive bacteria)]MDO4884793.1 cell division protein CrgA [Rothia sp. (in: high G+C Gram-positive bacteria)]
MSGSAKAKKKGGAAKSSGAKAKSTKKKQQKAEQKKVVAKDALSEERLRKVAEEMEQGQPLRDQTPLWYRVIMFSFLAVGLLWIVAYYIFEGLYPIAGIGMWNITIGIGALMVSMLMMTRWR